MWFVNELEDLLVSADAPGKEILWSQYALHVDLYKHYIDVIIKVNVYHFTATGVMLSFYLLNKAIPLIEWSL